MSGEALAGLLLIATWFGGIAVAYAVPIALKSRHIRRQNRLIDECRAKLILAVQHLGRGEEGPARTLLDEIRGVESQWRYGMSLTYRVALAFVAILAGTLAASAIRFAPLASIAIEHGRPIFDTSVLLLLGVCALHTVSAYYGDWHSPWIVDDCGDRLEALLNAGRGNSTQRSARKSRLKDGLAAREVFGLEPVFTLKQLNAARRRLASRYHPDRWHAAPANNATAAEDAMKRINAAYDELKNKAA